MQLDEEVKEKVQEMNSNPSFYPKHLAKQYVGLYSEKQMRNHENPFNQQQVGATKEAGACFTNINGKRSITPVNVGDHLNEHSSFIGGSASTETSPSLSSSSNSMSAMMDNSLSMLTISSRGQNQEPNKKILQGLPDSFIVAMKKLFDLLDVEKVGRVHIHGKRFLFLFPIA